MPGAVAAAPRRFRCATHDSTCASIRQVTPSGKILARVPPALHAELLRLADEQGVSLNQLVTALLAGGVGFKLDDRR